MDFIKNLFSGPLWTWGSRRILEIGGTWLVTNGFITEDAKTTTMGAIALVAGLIWNVISTFAPHITSQGKKVSLDTLAPSTKTTVEAAVARKPTLIERLTAGKK